MAAKIEAEYNAGNFTDKLVAFNTVDGKSWAGSVSAVELDYITLSDFGRVADQSIRIPPVDISGALPTEDWYVAMSHIVSWGILA